MIDFILWSPLILAGLYPVAIQFERGGLCRLLFPFYVSAGVTSTVVNYTWMTLLENAWPQRNEVTTSQRCERLVRHPGFVGKVARAIARYTNFFDPKGPHIPLP